MDLVYQIDSYITSISTTVMAVEPSSIAFAKTCVYPGGGGQGGDDAMVVWAGGEFAIHGATIRDGEPWYSVSGALPEKGEAVTLTLDWKRRYSFMRTHTAMHILCGVMYRDYNVLVTGSNMELLKGRMDFELPGLDSAFMAKISEAVNAEVAAARAISVRFLDKDSWDTDDFIRTRVNLVPEGVKSIRLVDIAGLDVQADGGTHVANTKEVGTVRFLCFENKGKNNKRLRFELDPA